MRALDQKFCPVISRTDLGRFSDKGECRITSHREPITVLFLHSSFFLHPLPLACAREQTHFGRTLDDVIIGNQITIVRDEKHRAGVALFKMHLVQMTGLYYVSP